MDAKEKCPPPATAVQDWRVLQAKGHAKDLGMALESHVREGVHKSLYMPCALRGKVYALAALDERRQIKKARAAMPRPRKTRHHCPGRRAKGGDGGAAAKGCLGKREGGGEDVAVAPKSRRLRRGRLVKAAATVKVEQAARDAEMMSLEGCEAPKKVSVSPEHGHAVGSVSRTVSGFDVVVYSLGILK